MTDLHLHLDGSLPVDTVIKLAKMQGIPLFSDAESAELHRMAEEAGDKPVKRYEEELFRKRLKDKLCVSGGCASLNDYLERFELPLALLQTEEALETAVFDLLVRLKQENVMRAEIRFAPQLHLKGSGNAGTAMRNQDAVVSAALRGLERGIRATGVRAKLILCLMRGSNNKKENVETVYAARNFLGEGVCAIDLAGAEGLYPTKDFREEFEIAERLGIPFTIHAGEAAGPESVWDAVRMGAKRIGHGINAIYDPELLVEIKKKGIVLETCPTSNIQTGAVSDIRLHPVRVLLHMGIKVTVNTDNMTVSDTTLSKEFELLKREHLLTQSEVSQLELNALNACF